MASNRIAVEKPLFERRAIMRADGPDREHLIARRDRRFQVTALATAIPATKVTDTDVALTTLANSEYAVPVASNATRTMPSTCQSSSTCWLGRLVRCRIHNRSVGQRLRARCQLRGVDLIAPHDVHYRNSLCQQIVGNDAAVAAPPHGFSAHDGAAIVAGQRSQLIQSGSESVRCRVIGIVPEGGDPPECIERWRRAFFFDAADRQESADVGRISQQWRALQGESRR